MNRIDKGLWMSKFVVLFVAFALLGCVNQTESGSNYKPTYNEDCEDVKAVKVFQTLNDGALASVCDSSYSDICMGATVFVPKLLDKTMWDDKKITPPKGKCFVFNDVYKYTSKDERNRTVPIADFAYQYSPKSDEELAERMVESRDKLYDICIEEFESTKSAKGESQTKCKCLADTMVIKIASIKASGDDMSEQDLNKKIVQECGSFPKSFGF